MSQEKKYSAKEAALAVLKKAHEVLLKSEQEKEPGHLMADKEKDQTPQDGVQPNNPDAEPKAGNGQSLGEKVNQVVSEHLAQHGESTEQKELEEEDGLKGHMKLAKFMGRMEQKRESKAAKPAAEAHAPLKKSDPSKTWKGSKRVLGQREHKDAPTGPTNYRNRNKSSDMDHGQKKGPQGYGKYQEQAQNQKGVHTPVSGVTGFPGAKGTSKAGDFVKDKYAGKPTFSGKDHPAIKEHKKVLSEMKAQPKPNLTKGGIQNHRPEGLKGVHEQGVSHDGSEGKSFAGEMSRAAVKGNTSLSKEKLNAEAKSSHKEKLGELKAMPKPNLTKARVDEGKSVNDKQQARAHRSFSHDVGVHKAHDKSTPGVSTRGVNARIASSKPKGSLNEKFHKDAAKRANAYVSADQKNIKPNLTKDEAHSGAYHAELGKIRQSEKAARETGASKNTGPLSTPAQEADLKAKHAKAVK